MKCPFCEHELTEFCACEYKCPYCEYEFYREDIEDYENGLISWINWQKLYNEFDGVDFSIESERKRFREEFRRLSELWINQVDFYPEDYADMWCEGYDSTKSVMEHYYDALGYLQYATDRMNLNRWLYIQIRLNLDEH